MNLNEIRLKGVDRINVAQDSEKWLAVCALYHDEGFGSTKCEVFLNYLSTYCFQKEDSAACS